MIKIWMLMACSLSLTFSAHADNYYDPNLDEVPNVESAPDIDIDVNQEVNIGTLNLNTAPSIQMNPTFNNYSYDNGMRLPPVGSIVPIHLNGNMMRVSSPSWNLLADLMQMVQYQLQQQGFNTNLNYYSIQRVSVYASSRRGAQVALLQNGQLISSGVIRGNNNVIPVDLFNSATPFNTLNWPLEMIYRGSMRVQTVTLFLTPRMGHGGGVYPVPPITGGNPYEVFYNGQSITLGKKGLNTHGLKKRDTEEFKQLAPDRKTSILYTGFRELVVSVEKKMVLTRIEVHYIDAYTGQSTYENLIAGHNVTLNGGQSWYANLNPRHSVFKVKISGGEKSVNGSKSTWVTVDLR